MNLKRNHQQRLKRRKEAKPLSFRRYPYKPYYYDYACPQDVIRQTIYIRSSRFVGQRYSGSTRIPGGLVIEQDLDGDLFPGIKKEFTVGKIVLKLHNFQQKYMRKRIWTF